MQEKTKKSEKVYIFYECPQKIVFVVNVCNIFSLCYEYKMLPL